jgi:hypothetical protein
MADYRRTDPPAEPQRDVHVYNQAPGGNSGGPGLIIGLVVVLLLAAVIWFAFARGGGRSMVPDQIDVDINLPEAPAPSTPQAPPAQPSPPPAAPPGGG